MKKIIIIPGVGLFQDEPPDRYLFKLIEKELPNFEFEWFNWNHVLEIPDVDLSYSNMRKWTCEVILDFQMIVKHALEINVPQGDYYIGHSAGSILALIQPRPSIICGSPAIMVEDLQGIHPVDCMLNSQPVYNLVHKRDLLAYPFPFSHVENEIISTGWWQISNWEPIHAHTNYFKNNKTCKKIVSKIKEWEKEL